jgi:hypothetical protein
MLVSLTTTLLAHDSNALSTNSQASDADVSFITINSEMFQSLSTAMSQSSFGDVNIL